MAVGAQLLGQELGRTCDAGLDGLERRALRLGHLGARETLVAEEHEGRPCRLGQLVERGAHALHQEADGLGVLRVGSRRSRLVPVVARRRQGRAARRELAVVQEQAVCRAPQIPGCAPAALEELALAPDGEERLLQEVLGVGGVACQAKEEAKERIALLEEQRAELRALEGFHGWTRGQGARRLGDSTSPSYSWRNRPVFFWSPALPAESATASNRVPGEEVVLDVLALLVPLQRPAELLRSCAVV